MKKARPALIVILSAAALIMAAAVIIFFVYVLALRTAYREDAIAFNNMLLQAEKITISSGGDSFEADLLTADYYNKFLLDRNTAVYSRRKRPETDETITITTGGDGARLSFTGFEDGSAIAVRWQDTGSKEKTYMVRSQTTFMQLRAYFRNQLRKSEGSGGE